MVDMQRTMYSLLSSLLLCISGTLVEFEKGTVRLIAAYASRNCLRQAPFLASVVSSFHVDHVGWKKAAPYDPSFLHPFFFFPDFHQPRNFLKCEFSYLSFLPL